MGSSNRMGGIRLRRTVALALGLAMASVSVAGRAAAGDGVQFSGDCGYTYVNKKVNDKEQWAITWEIGGDATGNVFMLDGSAPAQIECELVDEDDVNEIFDCYGSSACTGPPCGGPQWSLISTNVAIPTAFFLPPGVDPSDPESACDFR